MLKPNSLRLPLLATVFALAHCGGKAKQHDHLPVEHGSGDGSGGDSANHDDDSFSMTLPEAKWEASRFCGKLSPTRPEDPTPYYRFDRQILTDKLSGPGLTGWIHGAVPSYKEYIFTYRLEDANDPMAFFKAEQFSLVPANETVAQAFATLHRHDKVTLHGRIYDNRSPLTHFLVESMDVVEPYPLATTNEYAFDLAQLRGHSRFDVFGQVHATVDSPEYGKAFVVEHGDLLMPLAVPPALNEQVAALYRGDIINVAVKIIEHPHGPPHFEVDSEAAKPLQIVDPMLNCHNVETTVTGYLVKFNKSPAISRDVYAVRVVDANGIGRNFTFFPDTDDMDKFMEIFNGVSAKSQTAWHVAATQPTVARNYWQNPTIKVTAKGRLNVVSSEQANAQVYLKSVDDVTVTLP